MKENTKSPVKDSLTVKNVSKKYENHPSAINIKNQNLAKRSY